MEKLMLTSGRYLPPFGGDSETRLRSLEAYVAQLSEELEVLLGEMGRAMEALQAGQSLSASHDNGEGGV